MVRKTLRNKRGVTLIEFALVLPIFLVLVAAILDFGLLFFVQHALQFATREGARLALVGRQLTDPGGNPMSREASIVQTIRDKASIAMRPGDVQVSIYPINPDFSDPGGWQGRLDAGQPGSYMRVRTSYDFAIPLMAAFVPAAHLVLKAQTTYRNEQFN
jgi:hypothetical protein